MTTAARLYKWYVEDTGETIQLEYKPEEGNELKTHKIDHPELGVLAIRYLPEE